MNSPQKNIVINNSRQIIRNIDCRIGLSELEDNLFTSVITDPPYFIDGMGSDWDKNKLTEKASKAKVVGGLPVGMRYSPSQSKNLLNFLKPIAMEWVRVTRPGGFILCFMQPRLSHSAAMAMEIAGIEIRDMFVWKRDGQAKAFSQDHFINKRKDLNEYEKKEIINNLNGRKTPQLRPLGEMIILGQVPKEGTFVDNWLKWGVGLIDVNNPYIDKDHFPSTIMEVPKPNKKERLGHITAKPVNLLRHLIRIFGGKNPFILDAFAGCGSTAEASFLEECDFLGFEIDPIYAMKAKIRVSL